MFSNVFGNLFNGAVGPTTGLASLSNAALNAYNNQGMAAQQYSAMQAQQYQQAYNTAARPEWMIAGKVMSITEFADEIFGDTPARTLFLLKHSEK